MKFSHSIQFNAVPEWTSHYIAYSNLKKLIYSLEKEMNRHQKDLVTDPETSPLLNSERDDPDRVFAQALDRDLENITAFFESKEAELYEEVDELLKDQEAYDNEALEDGIEGVSNRHIGRRKTVANVRPRQNSVFSGWGIGRRRASAQSPSLEPVDSGDSDEEANENSNLKRTKTDDSGKSAKSGKSGKMKQGNSRSVDYTAMEQRRMSSTAIDDGSEDAMSTSYDTGVTLKKRMASLYVSLCELRSFVQLNKTGFRKVLKKYDKTLDRKLREKYMSETIEATPTFTQPTMDRISERISQIEQAYANIATAGNLDQAKRELRLDLREHVVWERNTVWREMIGIERKAQAANLGARRTILGEHGETETRRQGDKEEDTGVTKEVNTFVGKYRCPKFLLNTSFYFLIVILAIFFVLLFVPIMEVREQQNCLAMVILVSLLWATEAIPLFVTSIAVPFLVVVLRVVRNDAEPHERLASKEAASYIFSAMWTPVIMLLLGGFTIAAALSKYNIAKVMATFVLSKAGTKPRTVLITNMFVAMFLSMWISNVAAPVLCFSIIQPILRNLPNDSPMIKALLLGIALASNIGGAASPIASPQNLIALENMQPEPGWGIWFFISLPVCILSILLIWVMLLITLQPGRNTTIVPIRPMKDKFTGTQWFICAVTLATIALWCATHELEPVFGDMGIVAVIPMVLFFGTGILTKEDFNNFLWTIIILAAGGLALGKAVNSSGLLHTIAQGITASAEGMQLYTVLVVFAAMILVIASFISHTVAALIILPLVAQVGAGMPEPHPNLLVMGSVLMCSAAMALPTSGFPNMTAIMMEDSQTGQRYLQVRHFISRGIPASVLTFAVVISVGYGLMRAAGL